MDVRALLLGSKLRIAVTVLGGLVLVVGGAFAAGVLGVPSVERIENRFGDVNQTDTAIETDLVVRNPNPVGVRLGDVSINYTVSMNDIQMASGTKHGVGIGTGNSTVNLTTYLQNERIPEWWVSHIRDDEQTDLSVSATVSGLLGQSASFRPAERSIETDLISQFNSSEERPVNANVALVEDPILVIERTNASWGEVTASETPIALEFGVYNPKTSPVVITNIGYNITMNDVLVGQGETEETETIPGRTSRVVETPTVITNQRLDEWWVTHLENNQRTELRIDFYAEIQPPGTDDPIRVPLDELTYTKTIETDMFGNKDDPSGDTSGDGTSGSDSTTSDGDTTTEEGTTTAEDGTTTDASTTTDDSTTNGGSTTTDDGILARAPPGAP